MRHRKPKRYRGQHRAAFATRTRYGVVVGAAVVGAGMIAFGAGTALPQPSADSTSAAKTVSAGNGEIAEQYGVVQHQKAQAVSRASQALVRAALPAPEKLPLWMKPTNAYISSGWGYRGGEFHKGIDLAAPFGAPVIAASDGIVRIASWYGGYGQLVAIYHPKSGVTTYYGHNSSLLVSAGDEVSAGTTIALCGSTGQSSGNHVHFEVREGDTTEGTQIDPGPFMAANGAPL